MAYPTALNYEYWKYRRWGSKQAFALIWFEARRLERQWELIGKRSYVSPAHKSPALPVRFVRKQPA